MRKSLALVMGLSSLCVAALGCKPNAAAPAAPAKAGEQVSASAPLAAPSAAAFWTPLPQQLAEPAMLKGLKLASSPKVGELKGLQGTEQALELKGVGLNRCLEGWALQGFYLDPKTQKLKPTEAFELAPQLLKPNTPQRFELPDPARVVTLALQERDLAHHKGELDVKPASAPEEGDEVEAPASSLSMTFDAPNIGVAAAPGLSHKGCYSTGYMHKLGQPKSYLGPITGVWDRVGFYTIALWLDEQTRLLILWRLPLQRVAQAPQVAVELAQVLKAHDSYDVRVMVEYVREDESGASWQREPVEAGQLKLSFEQPKPEGPILLELKGLKATPALKQRFGEKVDLLPDLGGKVGFASDLRGLKVPVYSP